VEITWLGHSCFRIKGKEVTLVTDPCNESIGYSPGKLEANIITLSHNHPGHNDVTGIEGNPKVLQGPGEYEVSEVFVTGISTFHDSTQGTTYGKNTIYLIEMDEVRLCHLGDLGHVPSPQQVEELGNTEVLFIPVGGVSTIDAKTAAEIVRLLNPNVVIPMHYHTEIVTWLEPVDTFLKEMGLKEVSPQSKTSLTRSNLPSETQVTVLDYRHS
jgi:L-ascorbate metabolism protein UlaG (beta-lactamase superfamily)